MALNKQQLENKLAKLLSTNEEPSPVDAADCANKISDYVDEYLSGLELDPFPAPGVTAPPASSTDPTGPATKADPSAPLTVNQFRVALIAVMAAPLSPGIFDPACGLAFQADMALMIGVSDAQGYAVAGASVCATPPLLDVAFNLGKAGGTHLDVAKELANQIHTATTSTLFTAAVPYAKALFLQTPPTPPYTSPFK